METMRDIKRRINSVQNTKKITRAMKMVAGAKLRRAQEKAENARPFFKKTRQILLDVEQYTRNAEHPLLDEREGNKNLYILVTGDRGLCGPYNSRVIDALKEEMGSEEEVKLLTIGQKGRDYFARRNYEIISEYIQIDDYPDFRFARKISNEVISLFKEEVVDSVNLVYTHFESALSQEVQIIPLLPVEAPEKREEDKTQVEYLYEPSPDEVLDIMLPQYVNNVLYAALLESKASEFGSRMTAMDSATENAAEMIDELTLSYNRARQAEITKEITEIVSGAEALK
ncbi:MAG: ATP synthase F1 subunit gamma [Halanaerobiales bacterium]